jgi:hypothetical protein
MCSDSRPEIWASDSDNSLFAGVCILYNSLSQTDLSTVHSERNEHSICSDPLATDSPLAYSLIVRTTVSTATLANVTALQGKPRVRPGRCPMPQPLLCLDEDVCHGAERFRPLYSRPQ